MVRTAAAPRLLLALLLTAGAFQARAVVPQSERDALIRLYDSTNGASWSTKTGWKGAAGTECSWAGVQCNEERTTVRTLYLSGNNLVGSPVLGDLPNLTELYLNGNQLGGSVPAGVASLPSLEFLGLAGCGLSGTIPASLSSLTKLKHLVLQDNQLSGSIPPSLGSLANLEELSLYSNQLTGSVPPELGRLSKLSLFYLANNQLTGSIPKELSGLSSVTELYLSSNQLTGSIPPELFSLATLQVLNLAGNQLTGPIPTAISGLKAAVTINFYDNRLTGTIPATLASLPALEVLYLTGNQLTGTIPDLSGLSKIRVLDFGGNDLTGALPAGLGNPDTLQEIHVEGNELTSFDAAALARYTKLQQLHLSGNKLAGSIPDSLGSLTSLTSLALSDNLFTGSIPSTLGNLTNLNDLSLDSNQLTGQIPASLGNLAKLDYLHLARNMLSGSIPASLGNLSNVTFVALNENLLTGGIPSELGRLSKLRNLYLRYNSLAGSIPESFGDLAELRELDLQNAGLSGSIPATLTRLSKLESLSLEDNALTGPLLDFSVFPNLSGINVARNQLIGSIPAGIGSLANLYYLDLTGNQISGEIPSSLGDLQGLHYLRLSGNLLSGEIPQSLGGLGALEEMDLSSNRLSGSIPGSLGNLANVRNIWLGVNQLSGSIPSELGRLASIDGMGMERNQLSGTLPGSLGQLKTLRYLDISENRLTGLPAEIGGMSAIVYLFLQGNQLTGAVPASLASLTTLDRYGLGLNYNALRTDDAQLRQFIYDHSGGFDETQTIAPIDTSVAVVSTASVTLRWNPILYEGDGGGYQVEVGTSPGGPFTLATTVRGKSSASATVVGLTPGTRYSLRIRTYTDPHDRNPNTVTSEYTDVIQTQTSAPGSAVVTLTPASARIQVGSSVTITVGITPAQAAATTVTLAVANASLASAPASVTIPAGQTSVTVGVRGDRTGSTYLRAELPASLGGTSAAADLLVAYSSCEQPNTPAFQGVPSTAVRAGSSFTLSWTPTLANDPDGTYQVDISPNTDCTTGRKRYSTPLPSLSIPTQAGQAATYCALVRAVSGDACASGDSEPVRVQVSPGPAAFNVVASQTSPAVTSVGAPVSPFTASFKNLGSQAATLALASRAGTFTVSPTSVPNVPPGGTADVNVTFDPLNALSPAYFFDSLCGTWNDGTASRNACTAVTMATLATPPTVAATGARLVASGSNEVHFVGATGSAPPGQFITVVNSGTGPARIALSIGPGGAWLVVQSSDLGATIPAGGSKTIRLSVDRSRRSSADGQPPLSTNLTITTVDGPDSSRSRVTYQVFDEEPGEVLVGRSRATLAANQSSLVVPTSVSAEGRGTFFLSDGWIRNQSSQTVRATLHYTPNGGDGLDNPGVRQADVSLAPYATYRLADFVRGLFDTAGSGSVEIRSDNIGSLSVRSTVDSLTFKNGSLARLGAEIPTVRSREGTSLARNDAAPLLLTGLKGGPTSGFRTNVILSETSGRALTVGLRLLSPSGAVLKESDPITVLPYSKVQFNSGDGAIFPAGSFDGSSLEVRPLSGIGSVAAFATVIDNASQGYTTRSGQLVFETAAARQAALGRHGLATNAAPSRLALPAVARTTGRNDSFFTTNVSMANGTKNPVTVQLRYLPDDGTQVPAKSVTIPGRATVTYANILESIFGFTSNTFGMLLLEGSEAWRLTVAGETATPLSPNDASQGASPSTLAAYAPESLNAIGDPGAGLPSAVVSHPGLEESIRFRTNLILAEIAGQPCKVRIRLYSPGSQGLPLAEREVDMNPFQRQQIGNFIRQMMGAGSDYVDLETTVEWVSGAGRVLAVATKIDNDEQSKRSDVYVLGPSGALQGIIGF